MNNQLINFFGREVPYDSGMELFGGLHIGVTAFFLTLCAAVIAFRRQLRRFGHFNGIRRAAARTLFLNMLVHYCGRIAIGEWRFSEDLPLHVCFITNFFMIYILYTDNKRGLFSIVYFFTLIGPLPAIIFPDISRTWSGYLFYQFIISHHVMLLFSLYCAFVLKYPVRFGGAVSAFFCGNAYVAFAAVFNLVFSTNYVMLCALPDQLYEKFPFLAMLPAYIWLELAGTAALFAGYSLIKAFSPPVGTAEHKDARSVTSAGFHRRSRQKRLP